MTIDLNKFRQIADSKRPIAEPIHPSTTKIVTRTWPAWTPGQGTPVDAELVLSPIPKVREITSREVFSSGGRFQTGDLRIGPITPAWTVGAESGGYTREQLAPVSPTKNVEILYLLEGDISGEHKFVELDQTHPFSWSLVVRRTRRTP